MSFISPVNTITLDCSGTIMPNALVLADVDSNRSNELLVGTQDGELLIFKLLRSQTDPKLWLRAQGLGFITAITVGLLGVNMTEPRPIICVANAEGAIHLFLLRPNVQRNRVRSAGGILNNQSRNDSKLQLQIASTSSMEDELQYQQQFPIGFSQQLICNPKTLAIQEFNENEKQLIIGYCDRTIRVFTSMITEGLDGRLAGRFVVKHVFSVADHVQTIHPRRISLRDYELIVAQPGGNLLRFNPNEENGRVLATDTYNPRSTSWTEAIAVDKFFDETVYATVCDDHINIYSNQLNTVHMTIPLSVTVGFLFGLQKGPMAKDNYSQIVTISSVDGDTFIIDRHANIVRFRPPLSSYSGGANGIDSITNTSSSDQIQAFTSGLFGDSSMFCFIYVLTHNEKIVIVHSLEISNTRMTNLSAALSKTSLTDPSKEGISPSEQLKDLLHPRA